MHQIKFRNIIVLLLTAIIGLQVSILWKTKPRIRYVDRVIEKKVPLPAPTPLPVSNEAFDTGPVQVLEFIGKYNGQDCCKPRMTKINVVSQKGDLYTLLLCGEVQSLDKGSIIEVIANKQTAWEMKSSWDRTGVDPGCHYLINLRLLRLPPALSNQYDPGGGVPSAAF